MRQVSALILTLARATRTRSIVILVLATAFSSLLIPDSFAQSGPNSDPTYISLRSLTLGTEAVSVTNVTLKRDAAKFHLHSGTVCFVPPVNGMATGAVFIGDGTLSLEPPTQTERASLKFLTKEDEFAERFERLVLRFTDSTYDELKKAGTPATGGCDNGPLKDSQNTTRHKIKHNLEARLLEEVLSPQPRGLFWAFVHGKHYNDKEILEIDPSRNSDHVQFWTYDENKMGDWASFSFTQPHSKGTVGHVIRIEHQELDTTFEKSGNLIGKATTTIVSLRDGLRVIPLDLFRTLRVQSVSADAQNLSFIQEDKNDDGNFAVLLPKPLSAGEKFVFTTTYSGKDAVTNEGRGNYYPVARHNWYPNSIGSIFGEYVPYDMTFRIPKGMKMAATGALVSDTNEGNQNVTVWKSEAPQTVAGFSFGRFRVEEAKLTKPPVFIQSYANEEPPDWVQQIQHYANSDLPTESPHGSNVALGTMSTLGLNKKALAEGELAVQLYTDYFGPPLFSHIQLTQQTACNYGQSWPGLVWIPICYYFDTTVRHQLGLDRSDPGYWKVVTAHEVAHQWWGQTVGFSSGRDQWMSEGFAQMSASLYISLIEKDPKKFINFWDEERQSLLERDAEGFRAIDVGPVTMGYRASNSRTGFGITQRLIYPKGGYILHMIRLMMTDSREGDKLFRETMQDFVNTYRGKAATTEEFKAVVEKHMTPSMDIDGNHKLDWFFNDYVYGTQIPTYKLDYTFDAAPDGTLQFNFKLAQSNVDANFRMIVPIYLELDDGRMVMLGRATLKGSTSTDGKVPLKGLKVKPRRALVNHFDDVLASPN
ncbi:MAG TPA: M1 family aminopeptidase [Candidatus Limnocylindrales bacterium]|nr:M1 family aminopeptidase [Candidatus Limnocylindrales bacterium]